jgi:hypothetical protein
LMHVASPWIIQINTKTWVDWWYHSFDRDIASANKYNCHLST